MKTMIQAIEESGYTCSEGVTCALLTNTEGSVGDWWRAHGDEDRGEVYVVYHMVDDAIDIALLDAGIDSRDLSDVNAKTIWEIVQTEYERVAEGIRWWLDGYELGCDTAVAGQPASEGARL